MMKTMLKVLATAGFLGLMVLVVLFVFYGSRTAQSTLCALIFAGMVTLAATYGILRNNERNGK